MTSEARRVRWQAAHAPGRGIQLHVRRVVEPSAPPVLLLHGLGVSGSVLQPFARRLLPEFAAVVPDLRGHGQSDKPLDGYFSADYAADLAELIDAEIEPPVPTVGHSLGALVGMQLAASRPELVEWLVLLDPPLDSELHNPEVESVYRLRHAQAGELEAICWSATRAAASSWQLRLRVSSDRPPTPRSRRCSPRGRFRLSGACAHAARPGRSHARRGAGDRAAAAAVGVLGNATLVKIEGAPHAVHASHAAELVTLIRQFAG